MNSQRLEDRFDPEIYGSPIRLEGFKHAMDEAGVKLIMCFSLPSCKNLIGEESYSKAMTEKYIKTYKLCLAELEKQPADK